MNGRSAAAAADTGVAPRRPRILPALMKRETGLTTALLVILAAASAATAAYEVHGAASGGALPLIDRLLRRFDMTVLAGAVTLLVFRLAAATQADHRDGWMPAFFAAGGSRARYGTGLLISGLIGPAVISAAAALSFAATLAAVTGNAELLRLLPRTIGGALLVLGTWGVCTVSVAITVRRASATAGIIVTIAAMPAFLLLRHAFTEGTPPFWAFLLQLLSPLLFLPSDPSNTVRALFYIGLVGGLTALLSHRYAGRSL